MTEIFKLHNRALLIGLSKKSRFSYYEENYPNLRGMLDTLENRGLLSDVTPKNTLIYRMTEDYVRLVLAY